DLRMADAALGGPEAGEVPRCLLHRFPRSVRTHQRFLFSTCGDVLATGTDHGDILFYSLSELKELGRIDAAHSRPCTSAMLHPSGGALVSASGGRHFPDFGADSDAEGAAGGPPPKRPRLPGVGSAALDNSVRAWRLRPRSGRRRGRRRRRRRRRGRRRRRRRQCHGPAGAE
ncbi:unnamed protein product, partial [Prorocentrum cordatum]